jgi:hypothetical protein
VGILLLDRGLGVGERVCGGVLGLVELLRGSVGVLRGGLLGLGELLLGGALSVADVVAGVGGLGVSADAGISELLLAVDL